MKTLKFYTDPGHGWCAVPVSELIALDIQDVISPYSYISSDGATAYLEEDCDASTYISALMESGLEKDDLKMDDIYAENCFVRSLPGYPYGVCFDTYSDMNYALEKWRKYKKAAFATKEDV